MSETCARAVVMGLAALDDLADEAGRGPVQPSLWLRSLLALVYEASHASRKRDRAPFDAFWRVVQDPGPETLNELDRNYRRAFEAHCQVAAIARTFGMDPASPLYSRCVEGLRRDQRMVTDPAFRERILIGLSIKQMANKPPGLTVEEWERFQELGFYYERPRGRRS